MAEPPEPVLPCNPKLTERGLERCCYFPGGGGTKRGLSPPPVSSSCFSALTRHPACSLFSPAPACRFFISQFRPIASTTAPAGRSSAQLSSARLTEPFVASLPSLSVGCNSPRWFPLFFLPPVPVPVSVPVSPPPRLPASTLRPRQA